MSGASSHVSRVPGGGALRQGVFACACDWAVSGGRAYGRCRAARGGGGVEARRGPALSSPARESRGLTAALSSPAPNAPRPLMAHGAAKPRSLARSRARGAPPRRPRAQPGRGRRARLWGGGATMCLQALLYFTVHSGGAGCVRGVSAPMVFIYIYIYIYIYSQRILCMCRRAGIFNADKLDNIYLIDSRCVDTAELKPSHSLLDRTHKHPSRDRRLPNRRG